MYYMRKYATVSHCAQPPLHTRTPTPRAQQYALSPFEEQLPFTLKTLLADLRQGAQRPAAMQQLVVQWRMACVQAGPWPETVGMAAPDIVVAQQFLQRDGFWGAGG